MAWAMEEQVFSVFCVVVAVEAVLVFCLFGEVLVVVQFWMVS